MWSVVMSKPHVRIVGAVIGLIVWVAFKSDVLGQDAVLRDIECGWMDRQKSMSTMAVTWSQQKYIKAGTIAGEPLEDLHFETFGHSLKFRDNLMKYETAVVKLSGNEEPARSIDAFDGCANTNFAPPSSFKYGFGTVSKGDRFGQLENLNLWPILLYYRPFTPGGIGLEFHQLRHERLDTIRREGTDITCEVMGGQAGTPFERYRFWVGKSNEWPVLRVEKGYAATPSVLRARLEIYYTTGRPLNERLDSWSLAYMDMKGQIIQCVDANVDALLVNPTVPITEFSLEFPVGTVVEDYIEGVKYICGTEGKRIQVTQGNSYEEMLRQDRRRPWVWIASGLAFLMTVFVYAVRSRSK